MGQILSVRRRLRHYCWRKKRSSASNSKGGGDDHHHSHSHSHGTGNTITEQLTASLLPQQQQQQQHVEERIDIVILDHHDHDDHDHDDDQPPPPRDPDPHPHRAITPPNHAGDDQEKVVVVVVEQLVHNNNNSNSNNKNNSNSNSKKKKKKKKSDFLSPQQAAGEKDVGVVNNPEILINRTGRSMAIGPYSSGQRILLVGEGDFSFSASLAVAFGSAPNIIATSLNSLGYLSENYKKFPANKRELLSRGAVVLHGVDATEMAAHPQLRGMRFDCIVYNFPHVAFRNREPPESQTRRNQELVRGFLRNAKHMVEEEEGEIHVTHKSNWFFRQWDLPGLGAEQGLYMFQQVRFRRSDYPGYHTKYGYGGDNNFHCEPSKTYKFRLC